MASVFKEWKGSRLEVNVRAGTTLLPGDLSIPEHAKSLVVFVHGSGSSRKSPRNQYVAQELNRHGLATLLFDLLTPDEEIVDLRTAHLRFDIDLLAGRVILATDWLTSFPETSRLGISYFGASTGAGAALVAAAALPEVIESVVSRGGRPDLAASALPRVNSPTLLIVGENDPFVIELNSEAYKRLPCVKEMAIVQGATHLFEEPGTIERVARLAQEWFLSNQKK